MRILTALGGNALLRRGQNMDFATQHANVRIAVNSLLTLIQAEHELIITHGNGPQIGLIALQSAAGPASGDYPLDVLGAESEGMIGYMLELALANALLGKAQIATLLTQILVDAMDPAFARPAKPIGPSYDLQTAKRLEERCGWRFAQEGHQWRRVVASPKPLDILQASVIRLLVEKHVIVICAGGGGIPVARQEDGSLKGIEAVIDKDWASALLARCTNVDHLLLLTDVDGVYAGFGTEHPQKIDRIPLDPAFARQFPAGSIQPKLAAAISFARKTGRAASIGRLEDAAQIIEGKAGSRIS